MTTAARESSRVHMTRKEWRDLALTIRKMVNDSQMIPAVKLLRLKTDCGLVEAIHAVRRLQHMKPVVWANSADSRVKWVDG